MAATTVAFLPRLAAPALPSLSRWATFYTTRFTPSLLPSLAIAIPGVSLNLPNLLDDIWESVLRAVPKNKTSHSRKRHRQMAGKALEDVNHLCKCPGCGAVKRTHRLCQQCLEGMLHSFSHFVTWINDETYRNAKNMASRLLF
jgi:ribosomal protein L32